MNPLSVVIIAENEEDVIGRCLDSVSWADEILLVDSGSTDRTIEIAESKGARVIRQEWLGFSHQKNFGVGNAANDWVFLLDADEIVTPQLADNIRRTFSRAVDANDAFYMDRRSDFLGAALPNQSRRPIQRLFIRIYNRKTGYFDESMPVHEEVRFPGTPRPMHGPLLHFRGYTFGELVTVLNRYATAEAQYLYAQGERTRLRDLLVRPLLRFVWLYFVKREFTLGMRGFLHASLKAASDFFRYAELWELDADTNGPDPAQFGGKPPPDAGSRLPAT